nr:immunoglobulin heavy chain junction region [Macaca mulatta]
CVRVVVVSATTAAAAPYDYW